MKHCQANQYIFYMWSQKEKDRGSESLFKKIVAENFVTCGKKQIADPGSLGSIKDDESKETHIIKLPKIKDKHRTLKVARERPVLKIASEKGMRQYVQSAEETNCQIRIFYLAKLSFKMKGDMKNFLDK